MDKAKKKKSPKSSESVSAPAARAAFHRCRVEVSGVSRKKESSWSLGPGAVVSDEMYRELVKRGAVRADCFEPHKEMSDGS